LKRKVWKDEKRGRFGKNRGGFWKRFEKVGLNER
jgi:hypothetical protein